MAYFGQMTNIRAFSQSPNDDYMYVCGDYIEDDSNEDVETVNYSAGIARMKNDGTVRWYISATGPIPGYPSKNQDKCMGIAHNEASTNVAVLL